MQRYNSIPWNMIIQPVTAFLKKKKSFYFQKLSIPHEDVGNGE